MSPLMGPNIVGKRKHTDPETIPFFVRIEMDGYRDSLVSQTSPRSSVGRGKLHKKTFAKWLVSITKMRKIYYLLKFWFKINVYSSINVFDY